jgi:two-component system sensor histidine kinase HydH
MSGAAKSHLAVLEFFNDLVRYVGFTPEDGERLRRARVGLEPHFLSTAHVFYQRILEHPEAARALERGERQVGQLKPTLAKWMAELFTGPWDQDYVERRLRIGRVHVRIGLPQHYMLTAMDVVRQQLQAHLVQQVDVSGGEGLATLDAMNRLLDLDLALMLHTYKEDSDARQAKAERLATYGQLVGSIGHELRNPLGVIETSLYVLKGKGDPDEKVVRHLDRIGQQVTLANDIITQLLELIRERPLKRETVALEQVVQEAASTLPLGEVTLELKPLSGLTVEGDPTQLREVVSNLLENAVYAASPRGTVRLGPAPHGFTVEDSGPGISPKVAARLFEPLVTDKPKGIGLGLALVRRIVDRHGGTITVGRSALGGALFTVTFPPRSPP